MYKLRKYKQNYSITRLSDSLSMNRDRECAEYAQFLRDIIEHGISIVEGSDIVSPGYSELRQRAYPSYADQLDKIYHEGIDAWKADIQAIKDANPKTIEETVTVEDLPAWIQEDVDAYQHDEKLGAYEIALLLVKAARSDAEILECNEIIENTPQDIKDEYDAAHPVVTVDPSEYAPPQEPDETEEVQEEWTPL
jgi:hypothetical protein